MREPIAIKDLSPLRYPGSKRSLVRYMVRVLDHNNVKPDLLVEPFVGGGNLFLHFLENGIINKAIISDKDPLIYSFWKILFEDPDYLLRFIDSVEINLENFYNYKEIARRYKRRNLHLLAEACLFLNRTSFSGILTDKVGPLGGKFQGSKYKIDCRFNRDTLKNRIRNAAFYSERVIVLGYDWRKTMSFAIRWSKKIRKIGTILFYLDPPFFNKADELYRHYFEHKEHMALSKRLIKLNHNWLLSYDNADDIKKLYSKSNCRNVNIDMPYSLNSHAMRREKELVITPLKLPVI